MKILELLPLVVFFITYKLYGLIPATAAISTSSIVLITATAICTKKMPSRFTLISTLLMVVMCAITLLTENTAFIKVKATVFYGTCGAVLLVGLLYNKLFVQQVFGGFFNLSVGQWRFFSLQWVTFFVAAAVANEIMWRFYQEEQWVRFKVFIMPLAMVVFTAIQVFAYRRHLVMLAKQ